VCSSDLAPNAGRGARGSLLTPNAACTACHDVSLPASPATHLDGTYNSVWENGPINAASTRNSNTAHLGAQFFTPVTSVGSGAWDVQVTFDNNCYNQCHKAKARADYRHEQDTTASSANHWSLQMGTHLTYANGDRSGTVGNDATNAPFPIDCDLNTAANCADTDYAPCVSCHEPHGTAVLDPKNSTSNIMMRRKWLTIDTEPFLCSGCHP
jgi:hypothetical protein